MPTPERIKVAKAMKRRLFAQLGMLERDRRLGKQGIAIDFDSKALVWQRSLTEYTALLYLFPEVLPAN